MKKYCHVCNKKLKGTDFVDVSNLGNPLLFGKWCRSCFLLTIYKTLDDIKIDVSSLSARLEHLMENITLEKHEKESDSKTHL